MLVPQRYDLNPFEPFGHLLAVAVDHSLIHIVFTLLLEVEILLPII
ncbi:hypothetical protein ACW0KB_14325 [Virgibacillus salarius]|nr:hypothetical protein [uncultured Virgibacillus sp.]QRZ18254.1 hypothetical protein JUJ52_00325 [Virgibacillus sp. AGTR]